MVLQQLRNHTDPLHTHTHTHAVAILHRRGHIPSLNHLEPKLLKQPKQP